MAWSLILDIVRLAIWLVLLLAVFIPLELRWGLRPQAFDKGRFTTEVAYYFLSGLVPKLLLIVPLSLLAAVVHRLSPLGFYAWVGAIPVWTRLPLALLVGEVGSYWGHRWSHEIPWLWRFHSIHHSVEEVNWLSNSYAHPVDLFIVRLSGLAPMYLLGLAQPAGDQLDWVPLLLTVGGSIWGFFIHANVKWRFGALEWVLSSPAFHHWHHTNDSAELTNKNYAALFPVVDKMFGTFYLPAEEWPREYGIDEAMPQDLGGQLLHPVAGTAVKLQV